MKFQFLLPLLFAYPASAFVAGPSTVNAGENYLSLGSQSERGKVEPNENRSSFQDAKIDLYKLRYARGFEGFMGLSRSNLYAEYGSFKSASEQVGSTVFYKEDEGSYFTIGFAGDLLHDLDRQFGFYIQATPVRNYNKMKFSNPRLDVFALGLTAALNVTDHLFYRTLFHYGAGDGREQNSSIAIDTGLGYRLGHLVDRPWTVSASVFLEADTAERKDATYDAAFSPTGTQDRIRAFKYGTLIGTDFAISDSLNLGASQLQKLGGYDARATQIYNLNVGYKF